MTRRTIVAVTAVIAVAVFAAGAFLYARQQQEKQASIAAAAVDRFVRPHSPVIGPATAPVTIVEFFDPSCETCRAFYPVVKKIMASFPSEVRLVIRYTPLHQGSDEAVKILETARMQNRYIPVMEALLSAQPHWAVHGAPNLSIAWEAAAAAGLDLSRAQRDASRPEIDVVMRGDAEDIRALNVRQTPTFFVNGQPLPSFGAQELYDLVRSEVEKTRAAKR